MRGDTDVGASRAWEAEVMVRAAGWILFWRGIGFALGATLGVLAREQCQHPTFGPLLWLPFPAVLLALAGIALLRRLRPARWFALPIVAGWIVAVVPFLMPSHPDRYWDAFDLAECAVLPAYFMPDVYALYCIFRPDGREALAPGRSTLAPVATPFQARRTGRVLVAIGMVILAITSSVLCLVGLPGRMIS